MVLGGWLDLMILEVFSNLNDSMIICFMALHAQIESATFSTFSSTSLWFGCPCLSQREWSYHPLIWYLLLNPDLT